VFLASVSFLGLAGAGFYILGEISKPPPPPDFNDEIITALNRELPPVAPQPPEPEPPKVIEREQATLSTPPVTTPPPEPEPPKAIDREPSPVPTPPVATPPLEPEPPKVIEREQASLPRPPIPTPPPVVDGLDPIARIVNFVEEYNGGACFFAFLGDVTESTVDIVGFGNQRKPFETLRSIFAEQFGFRPDFDLQLVSDRQCVVIDFLNSPHMKTADRPKLQLDKYRVQSGDSLSGKITGIKDRQIGVIFVDNEGIAVNLNSLVTRSAESASFSFEVHPKANSKKSTSSADKQTRQLRLQLILSVASDEKLKSLTDFEAENASTLIPKILAEIREKKGEIAVAIAYFKFGD